MRSVEKTKERGKQFFSIVIAVMFLLTALAVISPVAIFDAADEDAVVTIEQGDIVYDIEEKVNNAIDGLTDGGTITVIGGTDEVYETIEIDIPSDVRIVWKAQIGAHNVVEIIALIGEGIFELAEGGEFIGEEAMAGIYSEVHLIISGGKVSVNYNNSDDECIAILTHSKTEVTGGEISVDSEFTSIGIHVYSDYSDLTITGGDISVSSGGESIGILLNSYYSDLTMIGGKIVADSEYESTGISIDSSDSNITMTGGEIKTNADDGYAYSISIKSGYDNNVKLIGGTLEAYGTLGSYDVLIYSSFNVVVSYLKGTATTGESLIERSGYAVIVEIETLSVPRSWNGTNNGLTIVATSAQHVTAVWNTLGESPEIIFDITQADFVIDLSVHTAPAPTGHDEEVTIIQGDTVGDIIDKVQNAIDSVYDNDGGTVTVISDGTITVDDTIYLNIPEDIWVIWAADLEVEIYDYSFYDIIYLDGDGVFEFTGSVSSIGVECIIFADNTDVLISGGTITSEVEYSGYVIYSRTGNVTVTGGDLTIIGNNDVYVIYIDNYSIVKLFGGTLTAMGNDSYIICLDGWESVAVYTEDVYDGEIFIADNYNLIIKVDPSSERTNGTSTGLTVTGSDWLYIETEWYISGDGSLILIFEYIYSQISLSVPSAPTNYNEDVEILQTDTDYDIIQYIQYAIDTVDNNGGGTVTVTGSNDSIDSSIQLYIPEGVWVIWKAQISASYAYEVINLSGGGVFELAEGGSITAESSNVVINTNYTDIVISGGLIDAGEALGDVIRSEGGNITVIGGTIKLTAVDDDYDVFAIYVWNDVVVTVSGGEFVLTGDNAYAIYIRYDTILVYLEGTFDEGSLVNEYSLVIMADTFSPSVSADGTSIGLTISEEYYKAIWSLLGGDPVILLFEDHSDSSLNWGTFASGDNPDPIDDTEVNEKGDGTNTALYVIVAVTAILIALALIFFFVIRPRSKT